MEEAKRKRASEGDGEDPSKRKKIKEVTEYEELCHINTMPPEILEMIFRAVDGWDIFSVVGRFVCKLWQAMLLQLYPISHDADEEEAKYSFSTSLAQLGMVSIMNWASGLGCPWKSVEVSKEAALRGQLNFLAWMVSQIPPKGAHPPGWPYFELEEDKIKEKERQESLQWLNESTCAAAASGGQLETLKWLRVTASCKWDHTTMSSAAREGHFHVLRWARVNGCSWGWGCCAAAARVGRIDVLEWLREKKCPWDDNVWVKAVMSGDVKVLECLRRLHCPQHRAPHACATAAAKGFLDVLKWLHRKKFRWDASVCSSAALWGHFDVLKWASERGCPIEGTTVHNAARRNNIEMLQWLYDRGHRPNSVTGKYAVESGSVEVVKWVVEHGCPAENNPFLAYAAAEMGHLDILKWLSERACPLDDNTYVGAAKGGSVEVLKWLRERGVGLGLECSDAAYTAAKGGHLEALKWMKEVGDTEWMESPRVFGGAAARGHLHVVQWLFEAAALWDHIVTKRAAKKGELMLLKWLVEQGCPVTNAASEAAAEAGYLETLKWLFNHGCPFDRDECIRRAKLTAHLGVQEWLLYDGRWSKT